MTHGQIAIKAGKNPVSVRLYTSHYGHQADAVKDLVEMPFLLHDLSLETHDRYWNKPKDKSEVRFRHGPWYLGVLLTCRNEDDKAVEDVYQAFRSGNYMELYDSGLANWMVACRFDRWTVVVDKGQISYARTPDVVVELASATNSRWSGYAVSNGRGEPEYWDEMVPEVMARVADRQKDFPEDCRVRYEADRRRFVVPFHDVLVHLAWATLKARAPKPKRTKRGKA